MTGVTDSKTTSYVKIVRGENTLQITQEPIKKKHKFTEAQLDMIAKAKEWDKIHGFY
jgi:hypothetical protein